MKKKLRIGLCGFGSMGKVHAFCVQNLPYFYKELPFEAEIAGVCTTNPAKAEQIAREYGFSSVAASEDELIADPDIDIIDICTPNLFHYDTVRRALAAKKHIYCEKPLCVTAAQAQELATLAGESGLICNVVFNNRHLAPVMRAKELVEELSDADITAAVKDLTSAKKKKPVYDQMDMAQMSLFDTVKDNDIIDEIKGLDMGNMTPIEAMNTLYNLQNKIKNRW